MLAELHSFTTYDGVEYILDGKVQVVLVNTPGNAGLPEINFVTQRTYKQDGVTEQAFYLQPRTLQLSMTAQGCSRQEFFQLRNRLIDIARPNRGGSPGYVTYTFARQDGTRRAIRGRMTSPRFPLSDSSDWDEYTFNEVLDLTCFDPTWFDPAEVAATVESAVATELVFPITFPITFGDESIYQQAVIQYTGNWYAYPIITIEGPCDNWQVEHQELGLFIIYTLSVADGETLTLNLQARTLTDSNGNDLWGGLAPLSEIQQFRIEPDPIVSGGTNTIRFYAENPTVNTNFTLSYLSRFIGI